MALDNLIQVSFSEEELKKIDEAITQIANIIKTKTINLSPDERKQYGRIADKNKVLVDKCKTYMEQDATTIPPTIDKAEFDKDYKARTQLDPIIKRLNQTMEMITDTKTMLDYDNYTASVFYYRYVKFLAMQNSAGATAIYKDLMKHYKGSIKTSTGSETEPIASNDEPTGSN